MIEQAANNNVTNVTTAADVVAELRYFDTDLLMEKGIPRENFVAVLNLSLQTVRNPFNSINKSSIQFRSYPDLAFPYT